MPVFKVNVKWNSQKFNNIEVDTDASPVVFKSQLFSLTGVPIDRQKVVMQGGLLGDESYSSIKLRNGATIMLMGSADEIPPTLTSNTPEPSVNALDTTVRDRTEVVKAPCGIINLGNTCYLNSTLQLLFAIPEFRFFLSKIPAESIQPLPTGLREVIVSLRQVFSGLSTSSNAIFPIIFLKYFQASFPQFATLASPEEGQSMMGGPTFQQQDANECWTELINLLQRIPVYPQAMTNFPRSFGSDLGWNPVDRFLTGTLVSTVTCTESEAEPPQESVATFHQLSCNIDKDVKYLHTGICNEFRSTLSKKSEALGREATYNKVSKISRLPGYLSVQFVRFFYKKKENVSAKILKDVKFPATLDLFEFCTKELQEKLAPQREKVRQEEDYEALAVRSRKAKATGTRAEKLPDPDENPDFYDPYWLTDDLGSNNTGFYELIGVVSHQGRMSRAGHYVAWIRLKGRWFKMDDTKVSEVEEEEIMKLSGGGEYHSAYILLYGPRRVRKVIPENEEMEVDTPAASAAAAADK